MHTGICAHFTARKAVLFPGDDAGTGRLRLERRSSGLIPQLPRRMTGKFAHGLGKITG